MRAVVCGANGAMGKLICGILGDEVVGKVSIDGENGNEIELRDEDDDEEMIYASDVTETVAGSKEEIMDAGFIEDEDSPEGIFDYDDGMDAGDEE